jgi:hypothetical protein
MKTHKFGSFREGGYYLFLIPFTSEKLTEKKIQFEWELWKRKKVWRLLPSLTLSYTDYGNIYFLFEFLKLKFSFHWFNWSSPQNKNNG